MDQPKIERVLKLMMLLAGKYDYTINELAEKLDTSPRSIYRYIDTFKSTGFAIHKEGDFYHIAKESKFFKDISQLVHFTEEEAFMVNELIEGIDNTNVIKQNLRAKLATIYNITSIADVIVKKENSKNVNNLIEAIQEQKQVILKEYLSANSHTTNNRRVEPFEFTTNYISVWCYDPKDKQNKLFKIERIGSVEVLESSQIYLERHNSGFLDIFRMHGKEQIPIKLELGTLAYNLITEEFPLSKRYLKRKSKNKWILNCNIADLKGAGRFVIGAIDDIKILEGDLLKKYIKDYVDKYLKII